MYTFENSILNVICDNKADSFEIFCGGKRFASDSREKTYYIDKSGNKHLFAELDSEIREIDEPDIKGLEYSFDTFSLKIWTKAQESELHFEFCPHENCDDIDTVYWPAPVLREYSEQGATVLPVMQGMLILDKEQKEAHNLMDGRFYSREGTMPWWGQTDGDSAYMALVDTPFDTEYLYSHKVGESTSVRVCFITSLGKISYKRGLTLRFYDKACSYIDFCKHYRAFLKQRGKLVTLEEKIKINPVLEQMIGRPVLTPPYVYYKIEPESDYYNKDEPEKNILINGFDKIVEEIKKGAEHGIDNAYVHIDGWGFGGYDNLCPRVLPPAPPAGGEEGLKKVIKVCRENGYLLAYHDQYRDYYLISPDYDENNAVMHEDGTVVTTEGIVWYGGVESQLCATKAIDYLRRNYEQMEEAGLKPDAAYLDVFSASILDECFNPEHPMTREECAQKRKDCFNYIRQSGMIISSEELMGEFADTLELVHHSPYINAFFPHLGREPFGINVPLMNLVFHDCVLIPWAMGKDCWGIPDGESGFLHCLLNGGVASLLTGSPDSAFENSKVVSRLEREVALSEMVSHEFIGESSQKTAFACGTEVTVDLKNDTWRIKWADGSVSEGCA